MPKKEHILIIGAGLCGSLLALSLAKQGYRISIVEKRPDLRKNDIEDGRSINMALSNRGLRALNSLGLSEKVKALCVPMKGRVIHDLEGNTAMFPYSGLASEYINSISRSGLTKLLLNEVEKCPNVRLIFNQKCTHIDLELPKAIVQDYNTKEECDIQPDIIIGADGAGSILRKSMFLQKKFLFNLSQQFLKHGYKELSIPPDANGNFQMENNALHIWPRGENMLIALPNLDKSFTVTLFLSYHEGEHNFAQLTDEKSVENYFQSNYPDALKLMPNLAKEFFEHPIGTLGTVKCSPWQSYGKTLLIGDAAHAIVPFYGQGMNASFEDVLVLNDIMLKHEGDWKLIFETYQKQRIKDTNAIADLAIDNFHEMKSHTASPLFQEKRMIETSLEQQFPKEYASKYRLVTFRENIPYSEAMKQGRAQDIAILRLLVEGKITPETPSKIQLELIKEKTKIILAEKQLLYTE